MVGTITIQSAGGGGGTTVTHPMWIQTVPAPYNPTQVVASVTNNGSHNATILWNTTTAAAGTYYYVSENAQAMTGTITLSGSQGYAPSTTAYPMGSFVKITNLLELVTWIVATVDSVLHLSSLVVPTLTL